MLLRLEHDAWLTHIIYRAPIQLSAGHDIAMSSLIVSKILDFLHEAFSYPSATISAKDFLSFGILFLQSFKEEDSLLDVLCLSENC
jgi:hypothetical protein